MGKVTEKKTGDSYNKDPLKLPDRHPEQSSLSLVDPELISNTSVGVS